jgi:hypothetical protein
MSRLVTIMSPAEAVSCRGGQRITHPSASFRAPHWKHRVHWQRRFIPVGILRKDAKTQSRKGKQ